MPNNVNLILEYKPVENNSKTTSILVIASMHRSGSSLVASLLQSAGLHIGRKVMLYPNEGNPKGYFESFDFWHFHRSVLQSQGIDEDGWTLQEKIEVDDRFVEEAKKIVSQNSLSLTWGWKEPRTTLFLDFWAELLPEANFLLIYRSPWEVIDSLYRRHDGLFQSQPELAVKIWQHYNQKILNFYNRYSSRCLLVNLSTIVKNKELYIEAINQKFHTNLTVPASTLYDPSLLHSQGGDSYRPTLIEHYFPEAVEMYQELDARGWQPQETPDFSWRELIKPSLYRFWSFQDWVNVRKQERQNKALQAELEQCGLQINQTETLLAHFQSQLNQIELLLTESQSQLHQTEEMLEQSQSQLHQTEEMLEQSQSQLHQTEEMLEQSQSQLHQMEEMLEQSQSQLHQTEEMLEQSQSQLHQTESQLHQTEEILEKSQSQLHQTEEMLEQSQSQLHQTESQLHQTEEMLEQSQSQLHQTEEMLEQSQSQLHQTESQLHQTEEMLEQSQSQLHQMEEMLEQSQSQVHQTQGELEQSQSQVHQTQGELEQSQSQLYQVQAELEHSHCQLYQVQGEVEQTKALLNQSQAQLHRTEAVLEQSLVQQNETQEQLNRLRFEQAIASQSNDQSHKHYELLVWDAWYAYQNSDMTKMRECLQQSIKCTPFSHTETVLNWLDSFAKFSSEKGCELNTYSLTNSEEWKQLMRPVLGARKITLAIP